MGNQFGSAKKKTFFVLVLKISIWRDFQSHGCHFRDYKNKQEEELADKKRDEDDDDKDQDDGDGDGDDDITGQFGVVEEFYQESIVCCCYHAEILR